MRNTNTLTVIYILRTNQKYLDKQSIFARITVNKRRAEISLKRYILVKNWDEKRGRTSGTTPKDRLLNSYLDEVYVQLLDASKQLLSEGKIVSAQAIKARFLGQDEQQKTLKELITYHNTTQVSVLKPGTMKNYYSTERYLHKFLRDNYNVSNIHLKQLDYKFITDFEYYIRNYQPKNSRRTCTNNGTMKHLERFMKMVNMAVRLEWLEKDPFRNYRLHFQKNERVYLTERELKRIEETTFHTPGMERVKDVFLFSCYTGLSYIDVKLLKMDQLVLGIDGDYWIHTKREKTSETVKIPLLPKAKEIVLKYEAEQKFARSVKLLPVYSNQRLNKGIREIAAACDIHKYVSFHTARHTFATTITLSNGVPIETVSKMLGHTKLSTTQIYARVLEQKIGDDMKTLRKKLRKKSEKAAAKKSEGQTELF